jgi:PqqD family protein of HPr-rel-A system
MTPRFAAIEGIRAFDFGDECIVFNPISWDAHLLNAASMAVLELFSAEPQTPQDIENFLREMLLEEDRKDAAMHTQRLLEQLLRLGLLRPIESDGANR